MKLAKPEQKVNTGKRQTKARDVRLEEFKYVPLLHYTRPDKLHWTMTMSDKLHWKVSDKFKEVSLDQVKKLTLEMDIKNSAQFSLCSAWLS